MGLLGRIPLKPLSFRILILEKAVLNELVIDELHGEVFIVTEDNGVKKLTSITAKIADYLLGEGGSFSGDDITITVGQEQKTIGEAVNSLKDEVDGIFGDINGDGSKIKVKVGETILTLKEAIANLIANNQTLSQGIIDINNQAVKTIEMDSTTTIFYAAE